MAERHLINESHVYVGEGALHITHACVHTPDCVQALLMRAKQFVCWRKPGRSGGGNGAGLWEICAALLGRSNLACREVASQSESLPIALGWSSCQASGWRGNGGRTLNLSFPHLLSWHGPHQLFQGEHTEAPGRSLSVSSPGFLSRGPFLTSSCSCSPPYPRSSRLLLKGHLPLLSLQGDCCLAERSWLWAGVDTHSVLHPALDTCRGPSFLFTLKCPCRCPHKEQLVLLPSAISSNSPACQLP